MRISVICAAVCCALFSTYSACAAPLSIEQRLAQLEALQSRKQAKPTAGR